MAENRIIAVRTDTDVFTTFEGYLRLRWDATTADCGSAPTQRPRRWGSVLALVFSSCLNGIESSLPTGKVRTKAGTVQLPVSGEVWAAHRSGPKTS